ncbi:MULTISPECIES: hypothetical protein [unclassified Pseudomonas]|uniref:hypothetical protein n=1 Tax=unclassified Pseudomonas TaxID=196821 RepID=UPI00087F99B4|nr:MULTISPECIES: hypothetical protein [unclassified Pseudomonas]SCY50281.1 hypothetical protein SAMN03159391_02047 [Pseudomonas sp. NFACC37-1]SFO27721.1 hypothetical protein SAMN03159304_02618 [Pseudomonas sp. NFACC24-1]
MNNQVLVLHRRMRLLEPDVLHCREVELRLAEDGRHVLLNRYVELYRHEHVSWCAIQQHRVPLAKMVRWLVDNGEQVKD